MAKEEKIQSTKSVVHQLAKENYSLARQQDRNLARIGELQAENKAIAEKINANTQKIAAQFSGLASEPAAPAVTA
jgi:hypothetical protein